MVAEYVFHRKGRSLGDFKQAWETARVEAGLPEALFHDLRRTAVRNLIRSGVAGPDQRRAMERVSA